MIFFLDDRCTVDVAPSCPTFYFMPDFIVAASSACKYPSTEQLALSRVSQLQYRDRSVKCCTNEHFHSRVR